MSIINTQVAQYFIQEEIGRGSFSIVYKAIKTSTKQYFALKQIKRNLSQKDLELIKNQIQILKSLNHNNIIKYYYDFKQKNRWFLVFQYCDQGDLYQFFKKHGQFAQYTTQMIIFCIAEALQKLHEKNIVHRDLKLANILINSKKQIKLADFGFSKNSEEKLMETYCGTPITMAPEIIQRQGAYSFNCDTWSLGIIAYQMIFGNPPFLPKNGGITELTNLILKKQVQFDEDTEITDNCKQFLKKCLDKNMKSRPSIKQIKKQKWLVDASIFVKKQKNIFRMQENDFDILEFEQTNLIQQISNQEQHLELELKQQYYYQYLIETMILEMLKNSEIAHIKYIYKQVMELFRGQNLGQLILLYLIKKIHDLDHLKIKIKYNKEVNQIELQQFKFFDENKKIIISTMSNFIKQNKNNLEKYNNQNIARLILDRVLINLQYELSNKRLNKQKLQVLLAITKLISTQYDNFSLELVKKNKYAYEQSFNFDQIKQKFDHNYVQVIKQKLNDQFKIAKNMVIKNPQDKQLNQQDIQILIQIISKNLSEV